MPPNIFISYRRKDSASAAGRLYDSLEHKLGSGHILMDVDNLPIGSNFVTEIKNAIDRSDILLVVIGRFWLSAGAEPGQPKLFNEEDFVRLEIEYALEKKKVVVPILVDGAQMPTRKELPASIHELPYLHGVRLRNDAWKRDFTAFYKELEQVMAGMGKKDAPKQSLFSRLANQEAKSSAPPKSASKAPRIRTTSTPAKGGAQHTNRLSLLGTLGVLIIALLIWGFWPKSDHSIAETDMEGVTDTLEVAELPGQDQNTNGTTDTVKTSQPLSQARNTEPPPKSDRSVAEPNTEDRTATAETSPPPRQNRNTDTSPATPKQTVKDPDGQTYATVRLADGNLWLAENLNYKTASGSWCYDNDASNCNEYGRLYTWEAAQTGCAALGGGWRLPTDEEWDELRNSYPINHAAYANLIKGGSSGFAALLGGYRETDGSFLNLGALGDYWSTTVDDEYNAYGCGFHGKDQRVFQFSDGLNFGLSVRCLQD